MLVLETFANRWLDRSVEFKLLGQTIRGTVTQVMDRLCASGWVVAEFRDGGKQVKVGGHYQAFRQLDEEGDDEV